MNENEKVKVLNVESGKRVRENALEKRIERKEGNFLLESENKKNEICNVEKKERLIYDNCGKKCRREWYRDRGE